MSCYRTHRHVLLPDTQTCHATGHTDMSCYRTHRHVMLPDTQTCLATGHTYKFQLTSFSATPSLQFELQDAVSHRRYQPSYAVWVLDLIQRGRWQFWSQWHHVGALHDHRPPNTSVNNRRLKSIWLKLKYWGWTRSVLLTNDTTTIPKVVYEYIPPSRRNIGRRRKRWRQQQPWRLNRPGMAYTLLLTRTAWDWQGKQGYTISGFVSNTFLYSAYSCQGTATPLLTGTTPEEGMCRNM